MPNRPSTEKLVGSNDNGFDKLFGIGAVLLVALAGALAMAPSLADADLWGHVQFGRDTIANGVSGTTSYSFTAEGFRWINHENLSEVTMALLVDYFGPAGLLWTKFLLSLFVLGLIIGFNIRHGASLLPTAVLTLLVAWNLGYHWSFRPQLASFVLFALLVALFQICFADWRDQWHLKWFSRSDEPQERTEPKQSWLQSRLLWFVVPIMLVWTNAHGGFVAGVCIAIAYLMLRAFESVHVHGSKGWGYARRMFLISAAIVACTLLNPYSYQLPFWLLESLGNPRPEIMDWSNEQLWSFVGVKFWVLLAVAGFAVAFTNKRLDFVHCCVLGVTLWQSLSHFRHAPFFVILCGFWLGPHLESALSRWKSSTQELPLFGGKRVYQCAAYLMLLGVIGFVSVQVSNRLVAIQVDRSTYPVDAFAFMKKNDINGKMVVTYNWAQYAIGALCVDSTGSQASRVAFDGRFRTCYPQEVVDMHFDFLYGEQDVVARYRSPNSPPLDPDRVLQYAEPELVINKRFDEVTANLMEQKKDDWTLLYQDGLAQVWGLKSKYDDAKSVDFLPNRLRVWTDKMPAGKVSWPAVYENQKETLAEKLAKN